MTNTIRMTTELYRIYNALNERYWGGELPEVFITITPGKSKKSSVYGTFSADVWAKNGDVTYDENGNEIIEIVDNRHEISMSAEYFTRPIPNWCATLQHEMVHLYCQVNNLKDTSNNNTYHNKTFKREAEKRGLIIEKEKTIGWSVTTPTHEFVDFISSLNIDEDTFTYFRQTRFGATKTAPKKRYVCPMCGTQAQAKKGTYLICGDCGKQMDYWDMTNPDAPEIIEDYNDMLAEREGWYATGGF